MGDSHVTCRGWWLSESTAIHITWCFTCKRRRASGILPGARRLCQPHCSAQVEGGKGRSLRSGAWDCGSSAPEGCQWAALAGVVTVPLVTGFVLRVSCGESQAPDSDDGKGHLAPVPSVALHTAALGLASVPLYLFSFFMFELQSQRNTDAEKSPICWFISQMPRASCARLNLIHVSYMAGRDPSP